MRHSHTTLIYFKKRFNWGVRWVLEDVDQKYMHVKMSTKQTSWHTIISEICWEWKILTAISSGSDVNQKFWVSTNLAEIAWHEHATMDVPLKRNC